MLSEGVDCNIIDNQNFSTLMWAARNKTLPFEVWDLLLDAGAEPNHLDNVQWSVVDWHIEARFP